MPHPPLVHQVHSIPEGRRLYLIPFQYQAVIMDSLVKCLCQPGSVRTLNHFPVKCLHVLERKSQYTYKINAVKTVKGTSQQIPHQNGNGQVTDCCGQQIQLWDRPCHSKHYSPKQVDFPYIKIGKHGKGRPPVKPYGQTGIPYGKGTSQRNGFPDLSKGLHHKAGSGYAAVNMKLHIRHKSKPKGALKGQGQGPAS